MITGISHLIMSVSRFDDCRDTYHRVVGLRELAYGRAWDGNQVSVLSVGPSVLILHENLHAGPAQDPETGQPITSNHDDGCWIRHFALPAVDSWTIYHNLAERGMEWSVPPSDMPIGLHPTRRRLMEFEDPELFTIQLAELIDHEGQSLPVPDAQLDAADQPWPGCDRIDHIAFNTPDMTAKRAFYTETLGLTGAPPQTTKLGEQSDLHAGETIVELIWREGVPSSLHAGTVTLVGFRVDDIGEAYATLEARGAAVAPPVEQGPLPDVRWQTMTLVDPDGLRVQLVEPAPASA